MSISYEENVLAELLAEYWETYTPNASVAGFLIELPNAALASSLFLAAHDEQEWEQVIRYAASIYQSGLSDQQRNDWYEARHSLRDHMAA